MLFEVETKIPDTFCRTCEFIEKWECGASYFFYCKKRKSNLTTNGLLKVKCKTTACILYKKEKSK